MWVEFASALCLCPALQKGPSVCSVIFSQKILEPFNNHQPYVAQTYHDEKSCLGLAGTAVSEGHGKFEEKEIKQCACVWQILVFFHCLLLRRLFWSSGGSAQMY